jgi:hypothetical protein
MNVICMCNEVENQKKKNKISHFAEGCSRQRLPLPRAMVIVLGKAGQQNCKNTHFPALPSAMTVALGKGQALPRAWPDWLSAKSFFLK